MQILLMLLQGVGWTLLALVGLLLLLLVLPHRIELRGEGAQWYRVRVYLWCLLPMTVVRHPTKPKKPKKERPPRAKKEKPKKQKQKKEAPSGKEHPPMTVWEVLELVDRLLPQLGKSCRKLLGRITITRCRVQLVVAAGDDPAATAEKVGRLEAALYSSYAAASQLLRIKEFAPRLYPCFSTEESCVEAGRYWLAVRVVPLGLLTPGLGFFLRALFAFIKR